MGVPGNRCIVQYTILLYNTLQYIKLRHRIEVPNLTRECVELYFISRRYILNLCPSPFRQMAKFFLGVLIFKCCPPPSHRAQLAKTFKKSKMPAPPRPKAKLRE